MKPSLIFITEANANRPLMPYDSERPAALGCIIFSALFCQSNTFVLERKLKDLHATTPITCFAIVGFLSSSIMALIIDGSVLPKVGSDIFILLLGGVLGLLGQFFTTVSLKIESAGKVALAVKSSQILFSFILQVFVFDDQPSISSIGGATIIVMSILISEMGCVRKLKSY